MFLDHFTHGLRSLLLLAIRYYSVLVVLRFCVCTIGYIVIVFISIADNEISEDHGIINFFLLKLILKILKLLKVQWIDLNLRKLLSFDSRRLNRSSSWLWLPKVLSINHCRPTEFLRIRHLRAPSILTQLKVFTLVLNLLQPLPHQVALVIRIGSYVL